MAPEIYGSPTAAEYNKPPSGGPMILPNESKDERSPVAPPWPPVEVFVSKAVSAGRITPFPRPKIVKKMVAVQKLLVNKIKINPMTETINPI